MAFIWCVRTCARVSVCVLEENVGPALILFAFIKITLVSAFPHVKLKDVHREACKYFFTAIPK